MDMNEQIIQEEQRILDRLLTEMDAAMLEIDKKLTTAQLQHNKAKGIQDAYGQLISAQRKIQAIKNDKASLNLSRKELYSTRIVLQDVTGGNSGEINEFKIGLHTYARGSNVFVHSWTMPL